MRALFYNIFIHGGADVKLVSNKIPTYKIGCEQCLHSRMRGVILVISGGAWGFLGGAKSYSL
jgi:hypothetical protein